MFPIELAAPVSGLLCGVLFGFVLENAGFGSPSKLTAQFRFTDWSVLKVMFTAIVVAATGLLLLQALGWLELDSVFVPGSLLVAAAVGGALVGAGFAVGGYCPGTSVVGMCSGRLDALMFLLGIVLGTVIFAFSFGPSLAALMAAGEVDSGDSISEIWGISPWLVVLVMLVMLVIIFKLAGRFERSGPGPVSAEQAVAGAGQ
ncbi:MAG: YeeE/YedE thiosulfate transporter family protein [Sphingomonadaceae bacterium]